MRIEKKENGKLSVIIKNQKSNEVRSAEEFDTVLFALGRTATTATLNLKKIGV
jgi:pyruvate/2-oxoglutarate dehydrogenase complex dihydrolipoamide dehydrogenase (E3) component